MRAVIQSKPRPFRRVENDKMKIIQYWCDKNAPNYVLDENICIVTHIPTTSPLFVSDKSGNPLITMAAGGFLTINADYAWDGATGIPDSRRNMFASLVHDALYQIMRERYQHDQSQIGGIDRKVFRKKADKLYKKLCLKNGVSKFFAFLAYLGIRRFAKHASQKSNTKSYWGKEVFDNLCKAPAKGAIACAPTSPV